MGQSGTPRRSGEADGNYVDIDPTDTDDRLMAKAASVRPLARQATWQEDGLTAFLHFGINTFYDQEWGHGTEDPTRFDPTGNLDPYEWVRQLRDAGFRTAILTLKHHDGFMLWPTRYSDHSIKSSPWKNGRGDIAAEFAAAARRYGMKVGFYLSPADSHAEIEGSYGNGSARSTRTIPTLVAGDDRAGQNLPTFTYEATDYGAFFLNTLYEVLTQYGEVSEVWFDGAAGNTNATEVFDYDAYHDLIRQLQPGANIAVGGRDIRWIGNEEGRARANEWSPLPIIDEGPGRIDGVQPGGPFSQEYGSDAQIVTAVRTGGANRLHWWPAEADMKLTQGWFAHPDDVPKSGATLLDHYQDTVGRNAVMLLNVPPTTTGSFAQPSIDAINAFAAERRKAFTLDHARGLAVLVAGEQVVSITNDNPRDGHLFAAGDYSPVVIDLGSPKAVARIGISEDILAAGQTIKALRVEARVGGSWIQQATAGAVGARRIIMLAAPVTAQEWRIVVTDARGAYSISDLKLWGELAQDPGKPSEVFIDCAAPTAGDGSAARPLNSLQQLRKLELAVGATINFRTGTDCADADATVWVYGSDTNPVRVRSWGAGSPATIGGVTLGERFADYAAQGWELEAGPERNRSPRGGLVHQHLEADED